MGARAKIEFKGRTVRVDLEEANSDTWLEVCRKAEELSGLETYTLKYEDEDGDLRILDESTLGDFAWVAFGTPGGGLLQVLEVEEEEEPSHLSLLTLLRGGAAVSPVLAQEQKVSDLLDLPALAFAGKWKCGVTEDADFVYVDCDGEGRAAIPKLHRATLAAGGCYAGTPTGPVGVAIDGAPLFSGAQPLEVLSRYHDAVTSDEHSKILGYAFDGFPVYGPVGFANDGDVKVMRSSYDGEGEFCRGAGDLDVCNGIYCPTPEYPGGVYHYVVTVDASALGQGRVEAAYPCAVPHFRGVPPPAALEVCRIVETPSSSTTSTSTSTSSAAGKFTIASEDGCRFRHASDDPVASLVASSPDSVASKVGGGPWFASCRKRAGKGQSQHQETPKGRSSDKLWRVLKALF